METYQHEKIMETLGNQEIYLQTIAETLIEIKEILEDQKSNEKTTQIELE